MTSFPQTWNRYGFVGGNPLINTDPLGLVARTCDAPNIRGAIAPAEGCGGDPAGEICHDWFILTGYCFPSSGPLVVPPGTPNPDQGGGGAGGGAG